MRATGLLVSFVCTVVVVACGGGTGETTPGVTTPSPAGPFTITSDVGANGGTLPAEYTCDGGGNTPALTWTNVPAGARELALLMSTLPGDGTTKWNWVLYGLPATTTGVNRNTTGIGRLGVGSDGPQAAYQPPCSQGPGPKLYTFTIYALSAAPSLPASPSAVTGAVLTNALTSITLGTASLNLTYTRPR